MEGAGRSWGRGNKSEYIVWKKILKEKSLGVVAALRRQKKTDLHKSETSLEHMEKPHFKNVKIKTIKLAKNSHQGHLDGRLLFRMRNVLSPT